MVHIGLVETLFQFIGCAEGTYLSVHHDRDAVAVFSLVHIMSGHEDRDATTGSVVDELPELAACSGIDTTCGFVKEHHTRIVEYRDGEGQLLLPA